MKSVLTLILFFLSFGTAYANQPPTGDQSVRQIYAFTGIEVLGSAAIVLLSLFVILASYFLRKRADFSEEGVVRLVSLVLIVSGTLFLVTLGYSAEQIAPALGILGTIAGYMLGRSAKLEDSERPQPKPQAESENAK